MSTTTSNLIKVGSEPMVVMPLRKWRALENVLENLEDKVRFLSAYQESHGKRSIDLVALKKKYKL